MVILRCSPKFDSTNSAHRSPKATDFPLGDSCYYHTYRRKQYPLSDGHSAPFAGAMRLGRMAVFEIFELFLSEKQNCGMLFECPSSLQETAMVERSRKSRLTAGLCATQRGADELRRRFANSSHERGGKFSAANSENAERISLRESLVRSPCRAVPRCPEMAPPPPSLRAQRSNPGATARGPWIASSQGLLAMTVNGREGLAKKEKGTEKGA